MYQWRRQKGQIFLTLTTYGLIRPTIYTPSDTPSSFNTMRVTLTTLFIPLGFVMLASILAKKADNKKTEKVNGKKGSKTEKYTSSSGSNFRDRTNYKIKALEMHIDALKLEMAELRQSYFTQPRTGTHTQRHRRTTTANHDKP